jgi:spermidine/putrescine transport system substrate-binding protein
MFRRMLFAAAALALLLAPLPAAAQAKELKMFNWSNYIPPDLLKRFEAETGIKVILDSYDSNESMLSKLQAGGTGYDLVVPTGPTLKNMVRDGMLLRIDAASLPNFKGVGAPFDKPDFDPERAYSVPYMWGTTGIAYDTAVTGGKLEESWKVMFDPPPSLVGKVGMLNAPGEAWNSAAHFLGIDRCSEKPDDAQRIYDLLARQKPAVTIFSSNATADRVAAGEVAMQQMWNGAYRRAKARKATLDWIYPKEGLDVWSDNFAVPKGAPNFENAKIFLNWIMEPKNIAEASNFLGYNNAIPASAPLLSDALRNEPAVNTPPEMLARLRPLGNCGPASLDLRDKVWTRLRR